MTDERSARLAAAAQLREKAAAVAIIRLVVCGDAQGAYAMIATHTNPAALAAGAIAYCVDVLRDLRDQDGPEAADARHAALLAVLERQILTARQAADDLAG